MELNVILLVIFFLCVLSLSLLKFSLNEEMQEKYKRLDFYAFLSSAITFMVFLLLVSLFMIYN